IVASGPASMPPAKSAYTLVEARQRLGRAEPDMQVGYRFAELRVARIDLDHGRPRSLGYDRHLRRRIDDAGRTYDETCVGGLGGGEGGAIGFGRDALAEEDEIRLQHAPAGSISRADRGTARWQGIEKTRVQGLGGRRNARAAATADELANRAVELRDPPRSRGRMEAVYVLGNEEGEYFVPFPLGQDAMC